MTLSKRGRSTKRSLEAQVVSRSSPSPLAKTYKSSAFQLEWDNDVAFHVAQNLLRLRRFRRMSQSKVARDMGTSQSALARIESAQENFTLSTLHRLIKALRGRFHVSISPEEMDFRSRSPWWEVYDTSTSGWSLVGSLANQTATTDQLLVGFQRPRQATTQIAEARLLTTRGTSGFTNL
jgi:transcriptional regulator with XRE-family HTH domain